MGVALKSLTVDALDRALVRVTSDVGIQQRAAVVGEGIRKEDGVETAVKCVYRDLEFSRERVKVFKEANRARFEGVVEQRGLVLSPTAIFRTFMR